MNSRERVQLALNHREADHVPLDIGGTGVSQIHATAYTNLRRYLNLPERQPQIIFIAEQLARFETDVAERLETDFAFVMPQAPSDYELVFRDEGAYEAFTDEWGIGWKKPKKGGFYYDMYHHPLARAETLADFRAYQLPDPLNKRRYQNVQSEVEAARQRGKAVVMAGTGAGILEIYAWLRGYEQFYIDLGLNHEFVAYMLERLVEFKQAYWEQVLPNLGDEVDVVCEHDDLAGQRALLFSPNTYRSVVKPWHKKLFHFIKDHTPAKLFYHTDGAVRPLIGDLMDAGMDILNPVQFTAANMNLKELKQEFGRDLVSSINPPPLVGSPVKGSTGLFKPSKSSSLANGLDCVGKSNAETVFEATTSGGGNSLFWGAGVDTQGVLGNGAPEEVKADVKRNIEALAPGGGFIFATVHDIQANVPPENIMAMWETWKRYGVY